MGSNEGHEYCFCCWSKNKGNEAIESEIVDGKEWMTQYHLFFVKSLGHYYSWQRDEANGKRMLSRIDHCISNEIWRNSFPESIVQHLNKATSDYYSLVLEVKYTISGGGRLFCFFNHLLQHKDFFLLLKEFGMIMLRAPLKSSRRP